MYYRRKIILALLQQFGGSLTRTDFQKLLFLFTQNQSEPSYEFIPYKYGCFSYQANQDISTMMKYELIEECNSKWSLKKKDNFINYLNMKDRIELVNLYNKFKAVRGNELILYVYNKYPYYAINSEIANELLDDIQLSNIKVQIPLKNENEIFTIGYEGKTVEGYVNQLIKENIKVLCDIRNNPVSMKFGFSKNQIKNIVENVGIKYYHFPELGIESKKRKNLNGHLDYIKLFEEYRDITLKSNINELKKISELFFEYKRIALTCFEADYTNCHRNNTANALAVLLKNKYQIQHI